MVNSRMPIPVLPIRTERLILRQVRLGDEADLLVYRGLPEVLHWIPGDVLTPDTVTEFVTRRMAYGELGGDNRVVFLVAEFEGRVVGDVVLRLGDPGEGRGECAEIGWVLAPAARGMGLATQAGRALVRVAFEEVGAHKVSARVDRLNPTSAAVCLRLGLTLDGTIRADSVFKGRWVDLQVWSVLRSEWSDLGRRPGDCGDRARGGVESWHS